MSRKKLAKRTSLLLISVSPEEKKLFQTLAVLRHMTLSEMVRQILFEKAKLEKVA
jgi:hypothetical protein